MPDDSEKKPSGEVDAVAPKEEPDDGLTEEERKELDKGNDFLADCGCPVPEKKVSPDAPLELDQSTMSLPSKPREMFLPFQSITDRRFIEALPDGLLGDVYGRARIRLPYRVFRLETYTTESGKQSFESGNFIIILSFSKSYGKYYPPASLVCPFYVIFPTKNRMIMSLHSAT